MIFLLQTDPVSEIEKRIIRHAAMLEDHKLLHASLKALSVASAFDFPVSTIPVGTVEFVRATAALQGLTLPPQMSYPPCLTRWLHRQIREGHLGEALQTQFVKPRHTVKQFTGTLRRDLPSDSPVTNETWVWISEPVQFVSEWRYYVEAGKLLGSGRYDDLEDEAPKPVNDEVLIAIEVFTAAGAPQGYALDFGVLSTGETALIEVNDGWALGYYSGDCHPRAYANLLAARWKELTLNPQAAPRALDKIKSNGVGFP